MDEKKSGWMTPERREALTNFWTGHEAWLKAMRARRCPTCLEPFTNEEDVPRPDGRFDVIARPCGHVTSQRARRPEAPATATAGVA